MNEVVLTENQPAKRKGYPQYRSPLGSASDQMRLLLLEKLDERIKVLGISRRQAAFRLGKNGNHINAMLKNKKYWSAGYLLDLFVALGGTWSLSLEADPPQQKPDSTI